MSACLARTQRLLAHPNPPLPLPADPLPGGLLQLASTSISLGGNRFSGTLPSGWISPTLKSLDLSYNQLTGQLPASWAAPAGLQGRGAMPRLTSLALAGNALSGEAPSAVAQRPRSACRGRASQRGVGALHGLPPAAVPRHTTCRLLPGVRRMGWFRASCAACLPYLYLPAVVPGPVQAPSPSAFGPWAAWMLRSPCSCGLATRESVVSWLVLAIGPASCCAGRGTPRLAGREPSGCDGQALCWALPAALPRLWASALWAGPCC